MSAFTLFESVGELARLAFDVDAASEIALARPRSPQPAVSVNGAAQLLREPHLLASRRSRTSRPSTGLPVASRIGL